MSNYLLRGSVWQLHDQTDSVDALVASGDCFVTLATQLDGISYELQDHPAHDTLETVTKVLLDLQRRYKVVAKPRDYRQ